MKEKKHNYISQEKKVELEMTTFCKNAFSLRIFPSRLGAFLVIRFIPKS